MPTYEYRCRKGHQFEVFHSIRDDSPRRCPRCGSRAKRVPAGGAGLLFKGSGFYITDYRSSSYQKRAKEDRPAASGGAESSSGSTSAGSASPPAKKPAAGPARAKKRSSSD
ncbi:MAG: FmdB family zinc ribbon protein [Candidatus Eiseniibacteriota bacterium]